MVKKTTQHKTPTQAVIYARVSTEQQAMSGLGLKAQIKACREYAKAHDLEVVAIEKDEGLSGKEDIHKRPALQRALARVDKGAILIVYSLSRLARSQRMAWEIIEGNGYYRSIASATEPFDTCTPMGRAMLGMLAVWSALEADMISERTKAALAAAKARGTRLGAPSMLETSEDGRRFIDPVKIEIVKRIQYLHQKGLSLRKIVDELNSEQIPSSLGARWHTRTVRTAIALQIPEQYEGKHDYL